MLCFHCLLLNKASTSSPAGAAPTFCFIRTDLLGRIFLAICGNSSHASTASWILIFFWSIFSPWKLFVPTSKVISNPPKKVSFLSRCKVLNNFLHIGSHWIFSLEKIQGKSSQLRLNDSTPGLTRMYQVAKFTAKALLADVAKPQKFRRKMVKCLVNARQRKSPNGRLWSLCILDKLDIPLYPLFVLLGAWHRSI